MTILGLFLVSLLDHPNDQQKHKNRDNADGQVVSGILMSETGISGIN